MKQLKIEANIPENIFMEGILNLRYSGCDVVFPLSLYALVHKWNYNKLIYYINLLEI